MSTLYVTELAKSGNSESGAALPMAGLPAIVDQTVSFTTSSVQSAVFDEDTTFIRVHTDATCFILVGTNPTATTGKLRMAANSTEYFAVLKGHRLAVIGIA